MNLPNATGIEQNAFGESCLSGINVCGNTNVPLEIEPLCVFLR
jgi:hypothetical protein